jgi:hypothetical protein
MFARINKHSSKKFTTINGSGVLLVAGVFDDQADVMFSGELDTGSNVGGACGIDRIDDEVTQRTGFARQAASVVVG